MCESPSTTREHAPPRCLFPAEKDLSPGANLRKNLITVPSCAEHNPRFSKDDEYFFAVVTANIEGNSHKERQFSTKLIRALRRRPAFAQTVLSKRRPIELSDGRRTMAFSADRLRIERTVEKTARAIHYHATGGRKLVMPLQVLLPMFRERDGSIVSGMSEMGFMIRDFFGSTPWAGDNTEVFCYRLHLDETADASYLQMSFFQGFAALVAWGRSIVTGVTNREDPLQVSEDIANTRPSGTKPR
jgi:hypothetical protein